AERLGLEHGQEARWRNMPRRLSTSDDVVEALGRTGPKQAQVHRLLATFPMAPLEKIYRPVFETVLGEAVSTSPVVQGARGVVPVVRRTARFQESTLEEERERLREERVHRALDNPPLMEIWSGQSLNDLLVDLQNLEARGTKLEDVPLKKEFLRSINL